MIARISIITAVVLAIVLSASTLKASEIPASREKVKFAWGANLSGNVDMSDHDLSALGLNAEFGFRWKAIRFLGIGAEGIMMVNGSNRCYPLYVNFRTDFSQRERLVFLDLRGGASLNYFNDSSSETGAYFSGGVGITLATGKTFSSHIIMAYTYLGQEKCYIGDYERNCAGISMVTLRLGVSF